jgi:glycosyltransferase involved in cell wall biosynthesis
LAKINIVIGPLDENVFGGGQWCVMEYANGLGGLGHDVYVIPMLPSPLPKWFREEIKYSYLVDDSSRGMALLKNFFRILLVGAKYYLGSLSAFEAKLEIQTCFARTSSRLPALPFELWRAASLLYVKGNMRPADITIATSFETALPVKLYGSGVRAYFMQHFEPYFSDEKAGKELSKLEASLSYHLGLKMIANSTWLKHKVESEVPNTPVELCLNAIDHEIFFGRPKSLARRHEITVISYGGRGVKWKGFIDLARAVKITRGRCPETNIRWQVFGEAEIPPQNDIADYEDLGFLKLRDLADAYRNADILLSASWYESFPLFPLEAMACGLPVITTRLGTEDFALDGETAIIVNPGEAASISNGLIRLINNTDLYANIARGGNQISKRFSWDNSIRCMERILTCYLEG